ATPANLHDESARGLGLATVLEVVRRRRLLALLPCLFVLAAAASMALFLPSLWTAKATVLVNRQEIPEALVRSTVSADPEARLLTLTHETLDTPRLMKIIQENELYPNMRRSHSTADVVERMRKDIKIDIQDERERRGREWRSLVFTVAYTATDPAVAASVTNTLAALFTEENRRLREQRTRLAGQEQRITAYKEQNLGELPEQREVNLRTLERLQQQLSLAHENNRRASERRQNITQSLNDLDLASAMGGTGSAAGAMNVGPGETAAARLSILRNELAALQTTYSDKYPDVIQMKEQIRLLEKRVSDEEKKVAAAAASPKTTGPAATTSRRN